MSASRNGQRVANRAENAPKLPFERQKMSSSEISTDNGRVSGGCADLPYVLDKLFDQPVRSWLKAKLLREN
jgi:hypothetical protein